MRLNKAEEAKILRGDPTVLGNFGWDRTQYAIVYIGSIKRHGFRNYEEWQEHLGIMRLLCATVLFKM